MTVTNPTRGSFNSGRASETTCRTASFTRRRRSAIGIFKRLHALALAAVAAWCFLTALAGGLVGLVLGNIRLPVVLLAATSPAAGAGANIGISGIAALTAAGVHVRARRVDGRLLARLTPPSVAGAVAGGLLSGALPGDVLLVVIGAALLLFGLDVLRPRRGPPGRGLGLPGALAAGAAIGFLGGLVGLILGSLRLPVLLRAGEPAARAAGTNVAVGFFVGAAGVAGHLPGGVDWTLLAVGAAASVPGALLGARLTGRLPEARLLQAVGVILLGAGVATIVQGAV